MEPKKASDSSKTKRKVVITMTEEKKHHIKI